MPERAGGDGGESADPADQADPTDTGRAAGTGGDWPTTDLVAVRAATTPERIAVVDAPTGRSWTYRELDRWVDAIAARFAERDAYPGRVGVLSQPRPAVLAVLHACWRTGRTFVGLHAGLSPGELADQLSTAGVGVILAGDASRERAAAAVRAGEWDAATESSASREPPVRSLAAVADERPDHDAGNAPAVDVERDDVPVTLFTSGSTGAPKAVPLTVGNLVSSASASAFRLGVARGDRWLSPLPTYHMGGLAPAVRCALYGATVVLQREFDADATARALDAYDATGVSLVPTALVRLLDAGWTPGDALRFVLLGGAAASPDLLARCERAGVPVHPSWGMTETASQIATATPAQVFADLDWEDDADARPGAVTVGQPLVTTTVSVLDDDGTPVDAGEVGELVVDGPTVTPGYLDGDDDDAFGPSGLHTGDRGYRDADGKVYVTGRVDDMLVTGGENVQPAVVEDALRALAFVADAAVVGLPDPEWGERVAALVVPDADATGGRAAVDADVDAEAVRDAVRDRLGAHELPKTVAFADAIPRTASGTVDRQAVRERLDDA